jgi:hypothetical protein
LAPLEPGASRGMEAEFTSSSGGVRASSVCRETGTARRGTMKTVPSRVKYLKLVSSLRESRLPRGYTVATACQNGAGTTEETLLGAFFDVTDPTKVGAVPAFPAFRRGGRSRVLLPAEDSRRSRRKSGGARNTSPGSTLNRLLGGELLPDRLAGREEVLPTPEGIPAETRKPCRCACAAMVVEAFRPPSERPRSYPAGEPLHDLSCLPRATGGLQVGSVRFLLLPGCGDSCGLGRGERSRPPALAGRRREGTRFRNRVQVLLRFRSPGTPWVSARAGKASNRRGHGYSALFSLRLRTVGDGGSQRRPERGGREPP